MTPIFGRRNSIPTPSENRTSEATPVEGLPAPDERTVPVSPAAAPSPIRLPDIHEPEELWTGIDVSDEGRLPPQIIRDFVLAKLDPVVAAHCSDSELERMIERMIVTAADQHSVLLNSDEQRVITRDLVNDIMGLGPFERLLHRDDITDILVNGAGHVYVERHGKLELTDVRFRSDAHVIHIAHRIAASIGRHVDVSSPMLDARLADGSRVNVIVPPVSIDGPCISIRKFSRKFIGLDDMIGLDSLSPQIARFLDIVCHCRLNIIISGGTGSGKTTLLGAMSRFIDKTERIITIEDSAELQLQQPHVIRLETRPPSLQNEGQITQRDLLRNALRMRPDRIIVGEVRGAEAFDMLQAMNTGHNGSMSTVHANSPADAMSRIENMVSMATANLSSKAILTQMASAFHLVVQIERMRDGTRRVVEISEIIGIQDGVITMVKLFEYRYRGETEHGKLDGSFESLRIRPKFMPRIQYYGLAEPFLDALGIIGG